MSLGVLVVKTNRQRMSLEFVIDKKSISLFRVQGFARCLGLVDKIRALVIGTYGESIG